MTSMPEWFRDIMQFIAVPALGWLGFLHNKNAKNETAIAVLEAKHQATSDKTDRILDKLDDIEKLLRDQE